MKRSFLIVVMAVLCLRLCAQHEFADTLSIKINQPLTPTLTTHGDSIGDIKSLYEYGERFDEYQDSVGRLTAPSIYFPAFYPGQANLLQWGSGGIIAAGGTNSMPGLMGMESAVLNYYQRVGRFMFTAYGSATKIGYFRGLSTQWGYGGSLTYQASDNLSFTAFGSYATKAGFSQPALLGYADYPSFGGYANIRFGQSRFGVKVGAQSYYGLGSKHWQSQPIVMPYYRLANGAELGIDVGGILYNVLSNAFDKSKGYNPAMNAPNAAPPVPKMGPGMKR
jgi:hypothetical protein